MVDVKLEEFTAKKAVDAGLGELVKRGEVRINGSYELTPKGDITFEQNNFMFYDKNNALRAGYFKDETELLNFANRVLFFDKVKRK